MTDPYQTLGVPPGSDEQVVRRRYLELVRQFTPEHHPQKFNEVRAAYEQLKDGETRLRFRLFEVGNKESLDALLEDLTCQRARPRVSLKTLLSLALKP